MDENGQPETKVDDYHTNVESGITRGMLTTFAKSRRLFEHRYILGNHEPTTSDALIEGQLLHTCLLEPERLSDFQVWDYGARRGEKWETFQDYCQVQNKTIVTRDQMERCGAMGKSVLDEIGSWITSDIALREETFVCQDPLTGLTLKCRGDLVLPLADRVVAVDVKSTVDETYPDFRWSMRRYKYDWQHVHYTYIMGANFLRPVQFIFLAVRKSPPWTCQRYHFAPEAVAKTQLVWRETLEQLAACLDNGDFSNPFEGSSVEVTL